MKLTLDSYIDALKGKTIAVAGLGVSNLPLAELLLSRGIDVVACDRRDKSALGGTAERLAIMGARLRMGGDYLKGLDADIIFRTPGMHPGVPELVSARERGAAVTSEMELFFALCPCKTIAITGSDGKTTTTTVIAMMLEKAGYRVHLGGNIGTPLLTSLPDFAPEDVAVLELSSFQLHSMYCSPDVSVITNITPNHLDVHPDMDDYVNAKRNIFINQGRHGRLVLNAQDERSKHFAEEAPGELVFFSKEEKPAAGAYLRDGVIRLIRGGTETRLISSDDVRLPGIHNIENYMAAFAALDGMVPHECLADTAKTFAGVRHRLELVRELNGVRFYNDSIASSPSRTIAGLRSFAERPILIAGGYDKKIPFDELGLEVIKRVKALYVTGDTAESIRGAVLGAPGYSGDPPVFAADDLAQAVTAAADYAKDGDVVLLSPACASFDRFINFEERGDFFRDIVLRLPE